jgi:hypothetical protein
VGGSNIACGLPCATRKQLNVAIHATRGWRRPRIPNQGRDEYERGVGLKSGSLVSIDPALGLAHPT